jgi:hypothetical protein
VEIQGKALGVLYHVCGGMKREKKKDEEKG